MSPAQIHRRAAPVSALAALAMHGLLVPGDAIAADYAASGDVEVCLYWSVPVGTACESDAVLPAEAQRSITLSKVFEGPSGNLGEADVDASLWIGELRAYAYGHTPGVSAGIAIAWANSTLEDLLRFSIPVGTYPEDVDVTLSGNVTGTLSASVAGASASAYFLASLGPGHTAEWEWDELDGSLFDQSFAIVYTLVPGGTTLTAPAQVELNLVSTLNVTGQSLGSALSTGEADFYQAGAFLDLDVPAGVTWESASGVFLVPEPPRVLALACALGVLIGLQRLRPRRLDPLH